MPSLQNKIRQNKTKEDDIPARLRQVALAYLTKNPASTKRLQQYLQRKLKAWQVDAPEQYTDYIMQVLTPDLVRFQMLDDVAFANGLAWTYTRRGYASIDAQARAQRLGVAIEPLDQKGALLYRMKRKNWGPFATQPSDNEQILKAKQYLQRAGFSMSLVNECMNLDFASAMEYLGA